MILLNMLFFSLAAICNAIMDTSVHHYSSSIFTKFKNRLWWDGEISWRNKYVGGIPENGRVKWFWSLNKPVQLTDAFHFFKMLMIIFIVITIITFDKCLVFVDCKTHLISFLIVLTVYGFIWNGSFSLFYNKILKK